MQILAIFCIFIGLVWFCAIFPNSLDQGYLAQDRVGRNMETFQMSVLSALFLIAGALFWSA